MRKGVSSVEKGTFENSRTKTQGDRFRDVGNQSRRILNTIERKKNYVIFSWLIF